MQILFVISKMLRTLYEILVPFYEIFWKMLRNVGKISDKEMQHINAIEDNETEMDLRQGSANTSERFFIVIFLECSRMF